MRWRLIEMVLQVFGIAASRRAKEFQSGFLGLVMLGGLARFTPTFRALAESWGRYELQRFLPHPEPVIVYPHK